MASDNDLDFLPDGRGESNEDDFFAGIKYEIFTTLRVCIPATVTTWTPASTGNLPATVDVLLDFLRVRNIDNVGDLKVGEELLAAEAGSLRARGPHPIYRRVPVFHAGNPAMNQRGPIPIGTTGLLMVADRCLDQWKNTGGPLDPATADKHDINDGFFLPTVYHGRNTPVSPLASQQFGPDDGSAGLEIQDLDKSISMTTTGPTATVDATSVEVPAAAKILLGALAQLGVARLTDKTSADASMQTFITSLVVSIGQIAALLNVAGPVIGAPGSVTPVVAPTDFGVISSASVKVFAED